MTKATSSTRPTKPRASGSGGPAHPARAFHRIAGAYLAETYERFPESGSSVGYEKFDHRLSRNLPADHRAQNALARRTLGAIEALPEAVFRGDDYLDRRGMLAMLRTHLLLEEQFARWQTNPQRHVNGAIDAVFELVIRDPDRLKRVAPAIASRLALLPGHLRAGAACVRHPVPLWTDLAVKACEGGIEFLDGLEPQLTAATDDPTQMRVLLAGAKKAFAGYARAIQRKAPGPACGFSLGREAFEILLRERLGLDLSLPEIEADGWNLVRELEAEIRREAARAGLRDAREAIERAAAAWLPQRPLIEEYRATTAAVRDRLIKLGLVTMPVGETLKVLPVPPFLRHQFPTAAYHQPPAFSRRQQGIFWVNDLSLLAPDPAKKRAEIRQHYGLELTAAHEAYPGHHLQFAIQNRHPSKLRRLFAHAIFYEGWTLWCEKMCVDEGLVTLPHAKLMQLHDALWRACRIVIDCGLHSGSLTCDGACRLLMKGVGFTRARAEGDVNWYTSSPTVPMSYLLGRLEVERLHRHFVTGEGWTLRQFNDWMLSHGAIPWRWIMDARMRGVD